MLPANDPQRQELNNEVHARPTPALKPPVDILYLAVLSERTQRAADWATVRQLFQANGLPAPEERLSHATGEIGSARLTVEQHSEYVRFTFISPATATDLFAANRGLPVPETFLRAFDGRLLVALKVKVVASGIVDQADIERLAAEHFNGHPIIGSTLAGGLAAGFTDFRIHADGFSRLVVSDQGMQPRQGGRMIQRLLEVETYRMMALRALPVARQLWPKVETFERDLADIALLVAADNRRNGGDLLDRLTRLEAAVQGETTAHHYRFSASDAYYDLVRQRIEELREVRIEGLQTFSEFVERRLAPAMSTCRAAAKNLEALSGRIARTTQLLSTRVDIVREEQNRSLLEATARRAKLQLRLQQTVEGISIVAISYYAVGLIAYLLKGLKLALPTLNVDAATAVSVPLVILFVAVGLKRLMRLVAARRRGDTLSAPD
jgi:uncharacterized membrane-anchored protein